MSEGTTTNAQPEEVLTVEKMMAVMGALKTELPKLPEKRKNWFEKLMNKIGWYRKTEIWIVDRSKLDRLLVDDFMRAAR